MVETAIDAASPTETGSHRESDRDGEPPGVHLAVAVADERDGDRQRGVQRREDVRVPVDAPGQEL